MLQNASMLAERKEYLQAKPYEHSAGRVTYANGFKNKSLKSRLGALALIVPQTRGSGVYPAESCEGTVRESWRTRPPGG